MAFAITGIKVIAGIKVIGINVIAGNEVIARIIIIAGINAITGFISSPEPIPSVSRPSLESLSRRATVRIGITSSDAVGYKGRNVIEVAR